MKIGKSLVVIWLSVILAAIVALFWYNDMVYSLPTPVPKNYSAINIGATINVNSFFPTAAQKPLFIHFFNPDCPCSRFNIIHFKALVKEYSNKADFEIVVLTGKHYTVQEIRERFQLNIPILFDSSIAAACGVYSTPQAAIIDSEHKLYYRGNYNRSRYCTDEKSNYAQMALEDLLSNKQKIVFNQFALKAYGCQLPFCNK